MSHTTDSPGTAGAAPLSWLSASLVLLLCGALTQAGLGRTPSVLSLLMAIAAITFIGLALHRSLVIRRHVGRTIMFGGVVLMVAAMVAWGALVALVFPVEMDDLRRCASKTNIRIAEMTECRDRFAAAVEHGHGYDVSPVQPGDKARG